MFLWFSLFPLNYTTYCVTVETRTFKLGLDIADSSRTCLPAFASQNFSDLKSVVKITQIWGTKIRFFELKFEYSNYSKNKKSVNRLREALSRKLTADSINSIILQNNQNRNNVKLVSDCASVGCESVVSSIWRVWSYYRFRQKHSVKRKSIGQPFPSKRDFERKRKRFISKSHKEKSETSEKLRRRDHSRRYSSTGETR